MVRNGDNGGPLLTELRRIVGRRHVLAGAATRKFAKGYRYGHGVAVAVVRPGSLVEAWRVLRACVNANAIVIMQAANTGLTGGSTPRDDGYDRPAVIVSTMRLKGIHLVDDARQAICLPGSTLHELERALAPAAREPHSVIGSSCIGASVIGGICNNSGGALLRRGPAYTEMALYARVDENGSLELVNRLGLDLGDEPEDILRRVEAGALGASDLATGATLVASSPGYEQKLREIGADTPARFNADPGNLHGASGSAGRVAVFAVRVDTFPAETEALTFYLGANHPDSFARLRRDILSSFANLPISGEYIHRDAFDLADLCGKDTFLAIRVLGTEHLPALFAAKAKVDGAAMRLGLGKLNLADRVLQLAARLAPDHLPARMRAFRDGFEHHLVIKVAGEGVAEMRAYLAQWRDGPERDFFECSDDEARAAFLHRFAVAGAANRRLALDRGGSLLAVDVALPRNTDTWFERLPADLDRRIAAKVYYGHFFCHVFHQDYLIAPGEDADAVEREILATLDARNARYPAEHNVGHHYHAAPELVAFYRDLDPGNRFNPGIGRTPSGTNWT